jgi:Lon protease-like protein
MLPSPRGGDRQTVRVPLFPLRTVLFPGGRLELRIFEQRYLAMAKSCLSGDHPFGVCLITQGAEVKAPGRDTPEFAAIGTLARIRAWDMPQLGILQVTSEGLTRFEVRAHEVLPDGLIVGDLASLAAEPPVALADAHRPLADLLERLAARIGPTHFPETRAADDASWVGYRLAELLPLPLAMKQSMLEIDDPEARLAALQRFIGGRGPPQPAPHGQL